MGRRSRRPTRSGSGPTGSNTEGGPSAATRGGRAVAEGNARSGDAPFGGSYASYASEASADRSRWRAGRWRRARRTGPRERRSWGQRLVIVAGCVVTVALGASASSLTYVYDKYQQLPRVELSGVLDDEAASGGPQNFLIVGVDNAEGLAEDDPVRDGRGHTNLSDTIMVLRIDPDRRRASLLSLPRDLWVPIPGTGSRQRINTVLQRGGPELLIETLDEDFGIPVHHYVQVDFASFRGVVDAVDGVTVWFPYPARDRHTGLHIAQAGCASLGPAQALAYVRSRHYQQYIDGDWEFDPSGDLGRIDRQQDFIQRALGQAIEGGASNPRTLDQLIDVALDGVTVDDSLTADDIFRLANRFRSFEPQDLVTYSVPVVGDMVGEAAILRLVEEDAQPILDVFRGDGDDTGDGDGDGDGDEPGRDGGDGDGDGDGGGADEAPSSVVVEVLNGSGTSGQASEATRQLAGAGFSVVSTGEMPSFDDDDTVVRYPEGRRDDAELVASRLASGAELEESPSSDAVTVITGTDWDGVRDAPRSTDLDDDPGDDDPGDDADRGGDDDQGGGTTTTAPPASTGGDGSTTSTTMDLSSTPC